MTVENPPTESDNQSQELDWHRAAGTDQLDEGQVATCPAGLKTVALTKLHGRYGAVDNRWWRY